MLGPTSRKIGAHGRKGCEYRRSRKSSSQRVMLLLSVPPLKPAPHRRPLGFRVPFSSVRVEACCAFRGRARSVLVPRGSFQPNRRFGIVSSARSTGSVYAAWKPFDSVPTTAATGGVSLRAGREWETHPVRVDHCRSHLVVQREGLAIDFEFDMVIIRRSRKREDRLVGRRGSDCVVSVRGRVR